MALIGWFGTSDPSDSCTAADMRMLIYNPMESAIPNVSLPVNRPLPVFRIVTDTYRYVWRHAGRLVVPLGLLSSLNFGWSEYLRFVVSSGGQIISTGLFGMVDPTALFSR
jgi:hypothetical protein